MLDKSPLWLERLELSARSILPDSVYQWVSGGAGYEDTLRSSAAAWRRISLRPDHLRDVTTVSTSTVILDASLSSPIGVAPSGFHGLTHPDAEAATARAAATTNSLFVLSSRSSLRIETVAEHCGQWWYQVYVMRDRSLTMQLVRRAAESGARAIVLTVDAPVLGQRRRNRDATLVSRAVMEINTGPVDDLDRLEQSPSVIGDDIAWLQDVSGLPVVVKGVLRGDTAVRSMDAGAAAVWVSNHGGRQLDGAITAAAALPEVVAAVGEQAEVYVDGGIGSGTDVARALSLGARATFLGRPPIWGLAVAGESGVTAVLSRFRKELETAMRLLGRPDAAGLAHDLIHPQSLSDLRPPNLAMGVDRTESIT